MKRQANSLWSVILIIFLFIASLSLIAFMYISVINYRNSIYDMAEKRAYNAAESVESALNKKLDRLLADIEEISFKAAACSSEQTMYAYLEAYYRNNAEYVNEFRYVKNGVSYCQGEIISDESPAVLAFAGSGNNGCTGVIDNSQMGSRSIAFCVNVTDCEYADMIVAMMPINKLTDGLKTILEKVETEFAYFSICASDGSIVYSYDGNELDFGNRTNIFDAFYETYDNQKKTVDELVKSSRNGDTIARTVNHNLVRYAITVGYADCSFGNLYVVRIYESRRLVEEQYSFLAIITALIFAILTVLAVLGGVLIFIKAHYKKKIQVVQNLDPVIGCNTYKMFESVTEDILYNNKLASYAIIYLELSNFPLINSKFGTAAERDVLKFTGKVIDKCIDANEAYAYISDGKFVILIHYLSEEDIIKRIKLIYAIIYNYPNLKSERFTLRFTSGIVKLEGEKRKLSVRELLDAAVTARLNPVAGGNELYTFYNNEHDARRKIEAEIELVKDKALANGEFLVFFQPKYNIKKKNIDGAEALVRWYDSKQNIYRRPDAFMSVFETDGFITHIDHFVFEEVCKFLDESKKSGQKTVPISVNVSRRTAIQQNFIENYAAVKNKYAIPDYYIMIEFTESFAYEDYETLKRIITELNKNGMKCSIDDFGSGSSSYETLKELPMNELKLDTFFIKDSGNKEKDDMILQSVIELGKGLGLKVTQEGVETPDILKKITDYGCDVVQGYIYSKPICKDDFIKFINNPKELG